LFLFLYFVVLTERAEVPLTFKSGTFEP